MSTPVTRTLRQLVLFAAALAVLFAVGVAAGQLIDTDARGDDAAAPGERSATPTTITTAHSDATGHGGAAAAPSGAAGVRGLAVAERGLRLVVEDAELRRGATERLRLRIVDARGDSIRGFDVEHTKRMHLIVVRRDLTGFQHLHPTMSVDGTWSTALRLDHAGSYRVFADFSHAGRATTLAGDLRVDGDADLRPLPAPRSAGVSGGGYEIKLDAGRVRPGREALLGFTVTKDRVPVHVEPYLGADGHLVALRDGDLAFLHVHPADGGHGKPAGGGHDDAIGFAATFPTEGRYRLFLQFRIDGRVQTVAFTQEVK